MRKSTITFVLLVLIGGVLVGNAPAQHHLHGHHQKQGLPEAAPAPGTPESAGFASPPPSGTREGATGGLGINGPSIELPAISLKLPTIRIPGLTRFTTPPHMRVKEAIAPLVAAARQEFSFESGAAPGNAEAAPAPPTPGVPEAAPITPRQKELQKSFQKASYDDCPECQRELQLAMAQKVHVEDSLEQRLSRLESSIGRLVDGLEAAQAKTAQHRDADSLQPFPAVAAEPEFPVRRSSYQQIDRLPPRLLPNNTVQRLPRVW